MFKWLNPKNWSIVKVYRDFENFIDWKNTIKREESNDVSKFNKWKLSRTKLFDVYTIVSLEEEDSHLPVLVQRTKVLEMLNPLHRYLDDDLGFADCINCEFNQFTDEDKQPTLSYLVVYRFRFEKFSIIWLLKFLLILTTLSVLIFKYDIINIIYQWILSLISLI